MAKTPLQELADHGQSVWIDYLSRPFVQDGDLAACLVLLCEPNEIGCTDDGGAFRLRDGRVWRLTAEPLEPTVPQPHDPSHHLDLDARNWLEGYLAEYPYAVILVSHDRFYLA